MGSNSGSKANQLREQEKCKTRKATTSSCLSGSLHKSTPPTSEWWLQLYPQSSHQALCPVQVYVRLKEGALLAEVCVHETSDEVTFSNLHKGTKWTSSNSETGASLINIILLWDQLHLELQRPEHHPAHSTQQYLLNELNNLRIIFMKKL